LFSRARRSPWAWVCTAAGPPGAPQGETTTLEAQLVLAARHHDARLVPARIYAARLLGGLADPSATASLVSICDARNVPALVRAAACEALASRTSGTEPIEEALGRHARFLDGTTAPPVGALARAAAAANDRAAVPLLVLHLRDPETPAAELAPLAHALGALGDAGAAEPLAEFVRTYHAETEDSGLAGALAEAIASYAALAGMESAEVLRAVEGDPMSLPAARDAARTALAALHAPPPEPEAPPAHDHRPRHLSAEIVGQVLHSVRRQLSDCLWERATETSRGRVHPQARVVLAVEPDGTIDMVSVLPHSIEACVEPLVRAQSFPATRAHRRQILTHFIHR
jgi:hypothetical protein